MQDLLSGIVLLIITVALAIASYPRHGKTAAFVRKPFLGPLVSVAIVTGLSISLLLIATYFSNFDDITLVGAKHL
jgi:ABC-type spermidine/putrescine transport system permease subunit II